MLYNYYNFIFEKMLNESVLYYTDRLKEIFNKIDHPISEKFIEYFASDLKPDITFLDVDSVELGYITYQKYNDFKHDLEPTINSYLQDGKAVVNDVIQKHHFAGIYTHKRRNKLKIGRLVNKLFPGEFSEKEIETFVNKFKSLQTVDISKFEIIEGDAIGYHYNRDLYLHPYAGTLGNSCMNDYDKSFFELYNKNPEVCKMLILKKESGIIGRAIVWDVEEVNTNSGIKRLMDRVYAAEDYIVDKFINYAINNEWGYKTENSQGVYKKITFNRNEYKNMHLYVPLNDIEYKKYPYMDTFLYYDPEYYVLTNYKSDAKNLYCLEDMYGGFEQIRYY